MGKVKIYLQKKYFDVLDFKYFTNKIFWINEYEIYEKEKKDGQYMKLEYKWNIVYILLSRIDPDNFRNSYISQSIITSLEHIELESGPFEEQKIYYYLLDISKKVKTNFNIFVYRWLETLWISMLNKFEFWDIINPFITSQDIINSKKIMKKSQNNPSSYEEDEENINFYIKTFWANWKEASFNCLVMSKITNKPIVIFQVEDNESISISESDKIILEKHKIFIDKDKFIKDYINKWLISNEKITSFRKQWRFKANLIKKFWEKKCYLCWCNIENIIIASHIHRVEDISKDILLTDDEKFKQTADWDNWFWLCANHDKLFEYWIIYFDNKKLNINNKLLEEIQEHFIKNITVNFEIQNNHYNEKISNYLEKHKSRVLN